MHLVAISILIRKHENGFLRPGMACQRKLIHRAYIIWFGNFHGMAACGAPTLKLSCTSAPDIERLESIW
ncbi:MAG: hypothetical protein EA399_10810 [Desulfovibrionales bacterium]|nr:MAG: hypothetical protein EA399_10810 [Desulfovibrionales bacterium]